MSILVLLLVVVCVSSTCYVKHGESFTLDTTTLNPQIKEYKKAGIPYNIHWRVYKTPYGETPHDFGIVDTEGIQVIDSSSLMNGDYHFLLYTINLNDFTVNNSFYNVTIQNRIDDIDYMIDNSFIYIIENVSHIMDCLLIIHYKLLKFGYEFMRAAFISSQYVRDQLGSYHLISSEKNQMVWRHFDIDISHYTMIDTAHMSESEYMNHFRQRYTLHDYFVRNNAPYYELARYVFTIINDVTSMKFRL